MTDQLTTRAREALSTAVREAASAGNPHVEPVHVLLALLAQPEGTAAPLLKAVGADPSVVAAAAAQAAAALPRASGASVAAPSLARATYEVMTVAGDQATALGDEYVSTEHLLVGLAKVASPAAELLKQHGGGPEALLEAFTKVRGSARVTSPDPEGTYQALEKYGVDLTARAREGGSTQSSAATARSVGSCRCCRDGRRTTPF